MKKDEGIVREGNRLIAEFMGFTWATVEWYKAKELREMRYHKSWDLLMPVYAKLWKAILKAQDIRNHISNFKYAFINAVCENKVSDAFDAVVAALKVYKYNLNHNLNHTPNEH